MRGRAFTFAEVLVCLFLLSCSVLGLLAGHHYLMRSERANQVRHRASLIGYDVMTLALAEDFATSQSRTRTEVSDGFTYAVDDHLVTPDLKEVSVSVYFHETLGEPAEREFRLSTRIYHAL